MTNDLITIRNQDKQIFECEKEVTKKLRYWEK